MTPQPETLERIAACRADEHRRLRCSCWDDLSPAWHLCNFLHAFDAAVREMRARLERAQ